MRSKEQAKTRGGRGGESGPAPDRTVPLWSANVSGPEKHDPLPKPTHQLVQLWSDPA